jgi:hypothetical protein
MTDGWVMWAGVSCFLGANKVTVEKLTPERLEAEFRALMHHR